MIPSAKYITMKYKMPARPSIYVKYIFPEGTTHDPDEPEDCLCYLTIYNEDKDKIKDLVFKFNGEKVEHEIPIIKDGERVKDVKFENKKLTCFHSGYDYRYSTVPLNLELNLVTGIFKADTPEEWELDPKFDKFRMHEKRDLSIMPKWVSEMITELFV